MRRRGKGVNQGVPLKRGRGQDANRVFINKGPGSRLKPEHSAQESPSAGPFYYLLVALFISHLHSYRLVPLPDCREYCATMVTSAWFTAALGATGLLLSADGAMAKKPVFTPPSYATSRSIDFCPERCSVSGPNTGNWSVYPNFDPIKKCEQSVFYDFSLYDEVDDPAANHRIRRSNLYFIFSFFRLPRELNVLPETADLPMNNPRHISK